METGASDYGVPHRKKHMTDEKLILNVSGRILHENASGVNPRV